MRARACTDLYEIFFGSHCLFPELKFKISLRSVLLLRRYSTFCNHVGGLLQILHITYYIMIIRQISKLCCKIQTEPYFVENFQIYMSVRFYDLFSDIMTLYVELDFCQNFLWYTCRTVKTMEASKKCYNFSVISDHPRDPNCLCGA